MNSITRDIEEITGDIWQALFDPELPLTVGGDASDEAGAACVVVIDGIRQAAVITRFPTALAATLTASILRSQQVPTEAEILDAVGELCNMIAGNIKTAIAGPSALRPPHGAIGLTAAPPDPLPGAREVAIVPFTCDGSVFTVTVLLVPTSKEDA